jgi:hypothetical protein
MNALPKTQRPEEKVALAGRRAIVFTQIVADSLAKLKPIGDLLISIRGQQVGGRGRTGGIRS